MIRRNGVKIKNYLRSKMDKRLFFFIIIVPMISLGGVGQLRRADSAPTTVSEYRKYKKESSPPLQARKELSKSMTPQPEMIRIPKETKQIAKWLLVRKKNYHRDGELTDAANVLYTMSKEVNKHDLLIHTDEILFISLMAKAHITKEVKE